MHDCVASGPVVDSVLVLHSDWDCLVWISEGASPSFWTSLSRTWSLCRKCTTRTKTILPSLAACLPLLAGSCGSGNSTGGSPLLPRYACTYAYVCVHVQCELVGLFRAYGVYWITQVHLAFLLHIL